MAEKRDWIEWAVKIFNKGVEDDLFTGQIGLLEKPSNWQPIKAILSDRSSYEPPKLNLNKLKSECSYDSKQYALMGKKCPEGLNNRYDSFAIEYKLNICKLLLCSFNKKLSDGDALIENLYSQIIDQMNFR